MTIEPIAVIEYCNPIGSPIPSKFLTMDDFITLFSFSICNTVKRFLMSIRHKMPLIPCDTIVARAAPATSSFKIIMQNKSNTILRQAEKARNKNGVRLSPTARNILEHRL